MFEAKITKEQVNELPIVEFEGKIEVVDTLEKFVEAMERLNRESIVGIDTETRPSFKRGVVYKVSLMQLATADVVYLIRLNKIGFPDSLLKFLSNSKIKKIGLSLQDDFQGLSKNKRFRPSGFVDIQNIARQYGILELSLQKIFAILFAGKISKAQRLSNWERVELTQPQLMYAATDAWATLKIYQRLMEAEKLSVREIKTIEALYSEQ